MHWQAFEPWHMEAIVLQEAQAYMQPLMAEPGYGEAMQRGGPAYTLQEGGKVLICCGLLHLWEGRSVAWSLVAQTAGDRFIRIYRHMRDVLNASPIRRIECTVDPGFDNGHRLAHMLGFEREGLMRSYLPDGRDAVLYSRVSA